MKKKSYLLALALLFSAGLIFNSQSASAASTVKADNAAKSTVVKKASKKHHKKKLHKTKYQPYADPSDMRRRRGKWWKKSSETKRKRPNLKKVKKLNLRVSIMGNRVYVRSGKKVLYTMYSSAGMIRRGHSLTPRGTFYTNHYHPYRFDYAYYPVGWKGQMYLLHSTTTYLWSKRFNLTEARKLGKKPASHGCIRLTVSDAKWLHYHLPYHTKVIIRYR